MYKILRPSCRLVDSLTTVIIRMEYLNTYLLLYSDIVSLVWKTIGREAKNIVLLIFILWRCFNYRLGGAESLIYDQLNPYLLPARILAETINMTHSAMLYRLGVSKFYFYEPLLFQIFVPWKFRKLESFLVYHHFYSQQPRR